MNKFDSTLLIYNIYVYMYSRCFLIKRKTLKFIICAVIHNDFYLLQKSLYFDHGLSLLLLLMGKITFLELF